MVDTPVGPARLVIAAAAGRRGLLVLGHGAGGGIDAPDLLAVRSAAAAAGWRVVRVEQPYRVAGRRAPAPAARLDEAWLAVVEALRRDHPGPVVVGGRSSGARVACRTASACRAAAVVCLAFPLRPPRRPEVSRLDELLTPVVPRLVVQGDRDPFGDATSFPPTPGVDVVGVPGDHSLRRSASAVGALVVDWLARMLPPPPSRDHEVPRPPGP